MHKIKGYIISIILLILIIYLSMTPTDPEKHKKLFTIEGIDKIVHFLMYCSLIISLLRDHFRLHIFKKKVIFPLALLVYSISVSIELLQHFVTTERSGEFLDAIANLTGVLAGVFIYLILKNKIAFFRTLNNS